VINAEHPQLAGDADVTRRYAVARPAHLEHRRAHRLGFLAARSCGRDARAARSL